jgi:HEAT repeat protein
MFISEYPTRRIHFPWAGILTISVALSICSCVTLPETDMEPGETRMETADSSAASDLLNQLANGTDGERERAALQLKNPSLSDPAIVPALAAALQDPVQGVREKASVGLVRRREDPALAGVLPQLRRAMEDSSGTVAYNAAVILKGHDESPDVLLPALERIYTDDAVAMETRVLAAGAAEDLGAPAYLYGPVLVAGLVDDSATAGRKALNALRRLDTMPDEIATELVAVIANGDPGPATSAVSLMNRHYVPRTITDPQTYAVLSVEYPNPPEGLLSALMGSLGRGDANLTENAYSLLSQFGPKAADAAPMTVAVLTREPAASRNERVKAIAALGQYKVASNSVLQALLGVAQNDPEPDLRHIALFSLAGFGEDAEPVRADMETLAREAPDEQTRNDAAGALRLMDTWKQINQLQ